MTNINAAEAYRQMMNHLMRIRDASDWLDNLGQALSIYHGQYHEFLHPKLLDEIGNLPYPAILLLGTTLETPWTSDTLDIQVKALSFIMKETHWDGTAEMLLKIYEEGNDPVNDPYLAGYISEYFALSHRTPQNIMIQAKHYLTDGDLMLLRGYLAAIYGWLCRGPFGENAQDFLNELTEIMNHTQDNSIKKQIEEILEANS